MVSQIIDPTKNWVFHFGSLVKNEISLSMKEQDGVISFFIPLEPHRGITIELITLIEDEQIIEGKYTLTDSTHVESVVFQILELGKKLLGAPKGTMSRFRWAITCKD